MQKIKILKTPEKKKQTYLDKMKNQKLKKLKNNQLKKEFII